MACLAEPLAMGSYSSDQTAMCASDTKRRPIRSLFVGSAGGLIGSENAIEDENECAQAAVQMDDNVSENGHSESDFEPSGCSDSDSSSSKDEACGTMRASRKRKRDTKPELKRAAQRLCRRCDQAFASRLDLRIHEALPHPFVCDIKGCTRSFADEVLAVQHMQMYHDVRDDESYVCSTCDTFCLTLHDLHLHRQQFNHGTKDRPQKLFVCDAVATCRQAYKKKDKLAQHKRRYHTPSDDGSAVECSRCDATWGTRHERQLHMEIVHPNHSTSPQSPYFVCEYRGCTKSYSKREHLTRHVRATHDAPPEKPFGCDLCGVRFVYKHALARHHTNCHTTDAEKPYACSVCLLAFKKKSLLQAHAFVHTGVLPFACDDCGDRFLKRFQLVRHRRKHETTKPSQIQVFLCDHDDCEELLFSLQEKQHHLRDAHGLDLNEDSVDSLKHKQRGGKQRGTGRELRCLVCHQVFERIQNLRSHLRTHFETVDERKLHVCPMVGCEKAYTKKSNVMAHYNAVHDPVKSKRFKCPYTDCDGAFGYKKVLQTHITSIHEKTSATIKKEQDGEEIGSEWDSDEEVEKLSTKKKRKGRQAVSVLTRVLGLDEHATNTSKLEPATRSPIQTSPA